MAVADGPDPSRPGDPADPPARGRRQGRWGLALLLGGLALVLVARILGGLRGGEYSSAYDVGAGPLQIVGFVLAGVGAFAFGRRRDD